MHVHDMHAGTGLVERVDGLVGQTAVGDVAGGELHAGLDGLVGVVHAVVLLIFSFDVVENLDGFFRRGGFEQNLLEAAFQCTVFFDILAVLIERGGADALHLSSGEGGLEHVGGIEAPRCAASAHHRV